MRTERICQVKCWSKVRLGRVNRFDLEKQIKIAIEKKVKSKLKFGRALNLRTMLVVLDGGASMSKMTKSCYRA